MISALSDRIANTDKLVWFLKSSSLLECWKIITHMPHLTWIDLRIAYLETNLSWLSKEWTQCVITKHCHGPTQLEFMYISCRYLVKSWYFWVKSDQICVGSLWFVLIRWRCNMSCELSTYDTLVPRLHTGSTTPRPGSPPLQHLDHLTAPQAHTSKQIVCGNQCLEKNLGVLGTCLGRIFFT